MSHALQLVSKQSGKITIHAEITGYSCQAWAVYGFRAQGISTTGKDVRNVTNQKNIKGFSNDFRKIETSRKEESTQRLMELSSRSYYSDFDCFWDEQGSNEVNRDEIQTEWRKFHS